MTAHTASPIEMATSAAPGDQRAGRAGHNRHHDRHDERDRVSVREGDRGT